MKIPDYLERHDMSQAAFARKVGVSPGLVWQWLNGETRITAERAVAIEAITESQILRQDLRPDIYPAADVV